MATFQIPGATLEPDINDTTAPLVVLFERDDAIAVPLLSQLRLAGYDVRASRTPVELFDILGKHLTSLVLIDFGNATAGRREFWVALDAHRRGRSVQVMTFRYLPPAGVLDTDFEPIARALADVEVHGAHEFQLIIDGVRQRIPLHGGGAVSGQNPLGGQPFGMSPGATPPPGGIAPIGAALGIPSPFMSGPIGSGLGAQPAPAFGQSNPFAGVAGYDPYAGTYDQTVAASPSFPFADSTPGGQPIGQQPFQPGFMVPGMAAGATPYAQPGFMVPMPAPEAASPFAHPVGANPYAPGMEQSPFAQPLAMNPFAEATTTGGAAGPSDMNPFAGVDWAGNGSAGADQMNPFAGPTAPLGQPGMPGKPAWGMASSPSPAPSSQPSWPPSGMSASSDVFGSPYQLPQGIPSVGQSSNGFSGPSDAYAAFGAMPEPDHQYGNAAFGQQAQAGWGPASTEQSKPPISDVWTPPDMDGETGVVPEIAFQRQHEPADADWLNTFEQQPSPRVAATAEPYAREEDFRHHDDFGRHDDFDVHQDDTAPVPVQAGVPAIRYDNPAERALSSVLVEGALVSSQRMDALKGIQQMLATVDMNFKLGELALLFKFLSPDQLLAALLVSRGLVSPQQIAGLGRVKQELAGSGMDYDLETLLNMFHILPSEQLQQLRAELV